MAKQLSLAPLTKIIATICISMLAIMMNRELPLVYLLVGELVFFLIYNQLAKQAKTIFAFAVFALILGLIQYVFTMDQTIAVVTGLKMLDMGIIFLFLLVTTPLQELTVALVKQCGMSYQYAFMLTAALRFIPDFVRESRIVREAQMCRGLDMETSAMKKIKAYSSLVKPMVLRSLGKSETMALSLELRGFGNGNHKFSRDVSPKFIDYLVIFALIALVIVFLYTKVA